MNFAVLVLLIIGSSIAYGLQLAPIANCNQNDEYLKPNTISTYEYEVNARAKGIRRTANSFGLTYKCQLEVHADSTQCVHTLKVTECTLTETDPVIGGVSQDKAHPDSAGFSAAMQQHPLKFLLSNGTVINMIADSDDSLPILNVKRGIVSALAAKKPSWVSSDETEWLQDVQGMCPVNYTVEGDTVTMFKDINHCHFPSRKDWHYSPFSLIWNMTFLQSILIDSEARCLYEFGSDGLKKSLCSESHAISMPDADDSDAISFKTRVSRDLTLKSVSPKSGADVTAPDTAKSIVYEYERTTAATSAPADLLSKAQDLMKILMEKTTQRITPGISRHFLELVKLFREAPELQSLEVIGRPCVVLHQQCLSFSNLESYQNELLNEMAMNYFVSALVQCNSIACIREVRRMDEKGHIRGRYMDAILRAWSRLKITDTEFFTEIREICSRVQTRTCYLSMSAALHRFWKREKHNYKKQDLPRNIEYCIKDLMGLIGSDCSGPEKQTLMGLKSLGNMGSIVEKMDKGIEDVIHRCVHNDKAAWTVHVSAVQAARRLEPTDALYARLSDIVKDSSLDLEVRVWAYKIIVKRWPNMATLNDIKQYITSDEISYQLKKFIASNLRNHLKDRSSMDTIKFSKLIREVFYGGEIDDPTPDIDKSTESLELEEGAYHKLSFLNDAVNQFGIRLLDDNIFDGKAFQPFSAFLNVTVQLFGRDVNILEFLWSARNQGRTMAAMAEHFSTMDDDDELDVLELALEVMKQQEHVRNYDLDPNEPVKFNYKVDETLQQNLERIRKNSPLGFDPSEPASFLTSYRIFGDEMGFTTRELMLETMAKFTSALGVITQMPQHRSGAASIVEAFHFVPTMAGLPLNWTTNIVFAYHLDYSIKEHKISAQFSDTIEEQSAMIISLPNYAHGRIDTYSTASIAFDTGLSFAAQKDGYTVGIRYPKEPVQLQLSRKTTGCSRTTMVDLVDPNLDVTKNSWCVKPLGIEICHRSSHAKIANIRDKQWALMSQNANWETSINFGERAGKYLFLAVKKTNEAEVETKNIDVYREGQESEKTLSMNYKIDHKADTYSSQFTIPKLGIRVDAAAKPNDEEGRTTLISADIANRKYQLEHTDGQTVQERNDGGDDDDDSDDNRVKRADVYSSVAVLRAPTRLYTWNRTQVSFTNKDIIDHQLIFQPTAARAEHNRWFPEFWENPNLAWLRFGYVDEDVMEKTYHQHGHCYIKAPGFIVRGDSAVNEDGDHTHGYLNFTRKSLPNNKLQSFFNVSFSRLVDEDETSKKNHFGIHLPRVNWAVDVDTVRKPKVESNFESSIVLTVRRDEITPKDSKYDDEIEYWEPSKAGHFDIESQALVAKAEINGKEAQLDFKGSLSLPSYEPITLDFHQSSQGGGIMTTWDYAYANPNSDFLWKGSDQLAHQPPKDHGNPKGTYKHRSAFSLYSTPNEEFGIYVIDGNLDGDTVRAIEYFQSTPYVYNGTLVWNYKAPEYSDLTIDIVAESPVWELLNFKLKQVVFLKGEKMTLRNSLVDIDVDGSWKKGYQKNIQIKSKNTDLIPNMNFNLDFSDGEGLFKYAFPDRNLKIVEHMEMSKDNKEIQFTICKDRKCEDIEKDSDVFISQYTYTLDDPTHLAVMVIHNPEYVNEIDALIDQRLGKWAEVALETLADGDHPINKMAEPVLGMTIIEWFTSVLINAAMTGASVSGKAVTAVVSLEPFARPLTSSVYYHGDAKTRAGRAINHDDDLKHFDTHLLHYMPWMYYDLSHLREAYKEAADDMDTDELSVRPGPVRGKSYVNVFHMPIRMERFTSLPSINEAYFEENKEEQEDLLEALLSIGDDHDDHDDDHHDDDDDELSYDHPPFQYTFHHKKYTRFALIWGMGHVLTFDGEHVDLPSPKKGGCSHLLLHNRVNGQVTVARETDSLLLMFPEVKIELKHDGQVFVNNSAELSDLPVHGHDVNVTRLEDIIEVNTYHHLNIKCSLRHHYCLFSTTAFTHNSFVGIMGNNNGDPTDDIQQDSSAQDKFNVADPFKLKGSCKASREDTCPPGSGASTDSSICYGEFTSKYSHDYKTKQCYQIIDWDEFHNRCDDDRLCGGNGCASQMAYKALCGAHDIPMDAFTKCSTCTNGLKVDETETVKIQPEAEIILLIDTAQKNEADIGNRVNEMVSLIDSSFKSVGFKNVSYGLSVFTSSEGHEDYAEQYAMHGHIVGSLSELKNQLKRIDFHKADADETPNADVLTDAIDTEGRYYPFKPTAARLTLLITHEDVTENIDIDDVRYGLSEMNSDHLFAISSYPKMNEAGKSMLAKPDGQASLDQYPNGLHARWAFESDGAVLNRLDRDNSFLKEFADLMASRASSVIGQCRSCDCHYPVDYTPYLACAKAQPCDP